MRNVLILQGSEQTAKEGGQRDRGKKLKSQRAKTDGKWDRSRIYNVAVLSGFCSSSLIASGSRGCHLNGPAHFKTQAVKKKKPC